MEIHLHAINSNCSLFKMPQESFGLAPPAFDFNNEEAAVIDNGGEESDESPPLNDEEEIENIQDFNEEILENEDSDRISDESPPPDAEMGQNVQGSVDDFHWIDDAIQENRIDEIRRNIELLIAVANEALYVLGMLDVASQLYAGRRAGFNVPSVPSNGAAFASTAESAHSRDWANEPGDFLNFATEPVKSMGSEVEQSASKNLFKFSQDTASVASLLQLEQNSELDFTELTVRDTGLASDGANIRNFDQQEVTDPSLTSGLDTGNGTNNYSELNQFNNISQCLLVDSAVCESIKQANVHTGKISDETESLEHIPFQSFASPYETVSQKNENKTTLTQSDPDFDSATCSRDYSSSETNRSSVVSSSSDLSFINVQQMPNSKKGRENFKTLNKSALSQEKSDDRQNSVEETDSSYVADDDDDSAESTYSNQ